MSILTDLREASETAVEQLATRFTDLPRPVLAVIGAGDLAVERLAEFGEQLRERVPSTDELTEAVSEMASVRSVEDAREVASQWPAKAQAKAQKAAAEVASSLEEVAATAPAKVQGFVQGVVSEFPGKVSEIREALDPEVLKQTVEGYSQLAGNVYESLADRGEAAWAKVVKSVPTPGGVVKAAAPKTRTQAAKPAAKPARPAATARATAAEKVKPTAKTAPKPATARKPAATKAATPKPAPKAAATPAASKADHSQPTLSN